MTQQSDEDILNFALNLEYLEAEFYTCAVTGSGLPSTLRGGGPASIGCQKANLNGSVLVRAALSLDRRYWPRPVPASGSYPTRDRQRGVPPRTPGLLRWLAYSAEASMWSRRA